MEKIMDLKPHQQRVLTEKDELAEKLTKLNAFIGGETYLGLSGEERVRLAKQAEIMKDYLDILNERITAF